MRTAACPGCGSAVTFRYAASVMAVCEFCRSTLIRHDVDLENLGRMAECLEDASALQLGSTGRYRGEHFSVVGRIQLRFAAGLWNEWHILFDSQRSGWLSEGSGLHSLTFLAAVPEPLPDFDKLRINEPVALGGKAFTVTNLESAECIAGEGELPFHVGAGYRAPVADLRNGERFATLDYSDSPPLLFMGETVRLEQLKLAGLRSEADRERKARSAVVGQLACPSCGAPFELHAEATKSYGCEHCGALIDVADHASLQIIDKVQTVLRFVPPLKPGMRGRLHGVDYEVIGFLRRFPVVDGADRRDYAWSEYLLFNLAAGFRWLTEYNGHWGFVAPVSALPRKEWSGTFARVRHDGRRYRHFQSAPAKVDYVVGEFYWRVTVGELTRVLDYIAPPYLLSEEIYENEVTWSLSEYLDSALVWSAFKLDAPRPARIGVAPNQPSPLGAARGGMWLGFAGLSVAALLLKGLFAWRDPEQQVLREPIAVTSAAVGQTLTTQSFALRSPMTNLLVRNATDVENGWVALDMVLIESATGRSYALSREVSYYHGVDEGEVWSEGERGDAVKLAAVPPGTYYLAIEAEPPPNTVQPINDLLTVYRGAQFWSNFWITLVVLSLPPIFVTWAANAFEVRRWADSDHPRSDD